MDCSFDDLSELRLQLPRINLGRSSSEAIVTPPVKKIPGCSFCAKKFTGLPGFRCACGRTFCIKHRHPEDHICLHDFKKSGRLALEKANPICIADKLKNRV